MELKVKSRKTLILSDLHYPHCDVKKVKEVVNSEDPDLIVLLGDAVEDKEGFDVLKASLGNVIHVNGDDDVIRGDADVVRLESRGRNFTLLHGHQLMGEGGERRLAKLLMRFNRAIPPFLFCVGIRVKMRLGGFLVLGHSHAMAYFPSLQCINAGTMSNKLNLYNDRGYVVISEGKVEMKRIA